MAAKEDDSSAAAPAPAGGLTTKKLILIVGVALVVLLAGIGGAVFVVAKKAAAEAAAEAGDEDHEEAEAKRKRAERAKKPPVFVPLDPFVVNLTDRQQDRYAQIGMTLEIDDPKFGEQMKTFMPAIRNGILMILAHKSSQELLERQGKEKLAEEVMKEVVRPLNLDEDADNPIRAVHFSSFIIQ
jgi:flagellar FliL protein